MIEYCQRNAIVYTRVLCAIVYTRVLCAIVYTRVLCAMCIHVYGIYELNPTTGRNKGNNS